MFYAGVLRRLKDRVRQVRLEIVDDWIFHHDNAPSHTSFVECEVSARNKIATLLQPPYSPDVVPSEKDMKGNRYGTVKEVQADSMRISKSITMSEFQGAYDAIKSQ